MSIIIVEGVDGSGKTTLLRKLREQSDRYFWVASSSQRPKTVEEIQEAIHFIGQCAYLKLPVICDRFPLISEGVYGPVLRNHNLLDDLTPRQHEIAMDFLLEGVERVIYCDPPGEEIVKNLTTIGIPQLSGVIEKLAELLDKYEEALEVLESEEVPVYRYNYTTDKTPLNKIFFGDFDG